jgi:addiction module RelB/DinJ family antitoxin
MLQMRVTPGVKRAAEEVLHRLGFTMTEAIELFLRRLIVDQRLPFDVVALDEATFTMITRDSAGRYSQPRAPARKGAVSKGERCPSAFSLERRRTILSGADWHCESAPAAPVNVGRRPPRSGCVDGRG